MSLQHRLNALLEILVQRDHFIKAAHCEEKGLLHSPVWVSTRSHCLSVLAHVIGGELEEGHEVVWLGFATSSRLVLADQLHKVNSGHLWKVNRFHQVSLLSNVLDWVVIEHLLVSI